MKKTCVVSALALLYLGAAVLFSRSEAGVGEFDKLSAADKKVFQERFIKEIYPLMSRNGKDGCVGCHSGKLVSALHLSGDAAKDFQFLLSEGFFLFGDKGSLLGRVSEKDVKRRMPLHPRDGWKEEDIAVLRSFTMELDKKQKR